MQVASFDDVLEFLTDLDPWLLSLGIKPKPDRWHEALNVAGQARQQRQRIERGEKRKFIDNYISGLFDATEIHEIFRAFGTENTPALKEKLRKALYGPIVPLPDAYRCRSRLFRGGQYSRTSVQAHRELRMWTPLIDHPRLPLKNRLSDNAGGVKYFLSVLTRALRGARHFALDHMRLRRITIHEK